MSYLTTLLLSLFITLALIPLSAQLAARLHALDMPDARKIHTHPIPRTGGLAMAFGALIPFAFFAEATPLVKALIIAAAVLVTVGVLDDIKDLGYKPKFAAQVVAALLVIFYGGVKITSLGLMLPDDVLLPDYIAVPLTLLVIVGVTNAINLSDGLDGLAGGICLLIFCCIGYLGYQADRPNMALLSTAMVGAIFGFLRFNTYPATIFMGDTGSQLLGFAAVTLSLTTTQSNTPLSPVLPLLLLGFPILDTLTVMFERIHRGKSPFVADKNHFHHKLMRRGFTHSESVLTIYIIQSILVVSAYLLRYHSEWLLLFGYCVFSTLIVAAFFLADRSGWSMPRYDIIDRAIKGKVKTWIKTGILIRMLGRSVEIAVPLLAFITCLAPVSIPRYIALLAAVFFLFLVLVTVFKRAFVQGGLRNFYLVIPFILFMAEKEPAAWLDGTVKILYHASFAAVALLLVLTLKFTRRKQGFRFNLMDFLILFIIFFLVLIVPTLLPENMHDFNVGLLSAMIIVLLFGHEVLLGELRGNNARLVFPTAACFLVLALRGLVGW